MWIAEDVFIIFREKTQKYFALASIYCFNHKSVVIAKKEEAPTRPKGLSCLFNIISIERKI